VGRPGYAPAGGSRIAGSGGNSSHDGGMLGGRTQKSGGIEHPAPQVEVGGVERAFLNGNGQALTSQVGLLLVQGRYAVGCQIQPAYLPFLLGPAVRLVYEQNPRIRQQQRNLRPRYPTNLNECSICPSGR
jgi:hypothetical protein